MESKRTLLNNILRIVSAEEARNQALTEEFRSMRKELADQWGEICCTVLQTEKTQKTLVAMLRELITEVKNLHAPKVVSAKVERVPLTNDVIKIKPKEKNLFSHTYVGSVVPRPEERKGKEKDLFSHTKTRYRYEDDSVSCMSAVRYLSQFCDLTQHPYIFLNKLIKKLNIKKMKSASDNSNTYRLKAFDVQRIESYLLSNGYDKFPMAEASEYEEVSR